MDATASPRSISRRLTLAVVATTAGALLLASASFVLYDWRTGRAQMVERARMLAQVVATSSAVSLAFRDEQTARETLEGLSGATPVLAAAIYDRHGKRFAEYLAAGTHDLELPRRPRPGYAFEASRLQLFQPIEFQKATIGTLYLAVSAGSLVTRIGWYATIVCGVMLCATLWSAWAAARLRHQIARPLVALAEGARAIAEGDLSAEVPEERDDEIGALARAFNEMARSLRGVVRETRESLGSVSEVSVALGERGARLLHETQRQNAAIAEATDSVERVSASVRELTGGADRLAATSAETSSSIAQMDASIREIAAHMDRLAGAIETTSAATGQVTHNIDQVVSGVGTLQGATGGVIERLRDLTRSVGTVEQDAGQCVEHSEAASREASEGHDSVRETIASMGAIATAFGQLQERVNRLATKSRSIDEIVQVIGGVAEQTGLLALNASIIAAQAGEHGRAFSVVAEQVSSLADRSRQSARQIAELIRAIQDDTVAAVGAVEEGSAVVEHGVRRSQVAGEALNRIIDRTHGATDRVRQIADASLVQSESLKRVEAAVSEVLRIVDSIDRSSQQQQEATGEIGRAIESIRQLGNAVRRSTDEQRKGSNLITSASENLTSMATGMAKAVGEQGRSGETLASTLRIFNHVAEETARGVEAINAVVSTLSERARQLEAEIGRFRVE